MQKDHTLSSLGLILLVMGQLLPQLDFSIVNVGLNVIGASLHANTTALVLIVALYGVSFAVCIATGARLGDRFGRRKIFILGMAGFAVASALCAISSSIVMMLFGRLAQGLFGALLMPQILATIHACLSGQKHSRAIGIYTAVAGLSVALGQMLGGYLISADFFGLGWRVAFLINLPICVLIIALSFKLIPETRSNHISSMDFKGMGLFSTLLLSLLIPISMAEHWPLLWLLLLASAPLCYWLWKIEKHLERHAEQPLLPPSLFTVKITRIGFLSESAVTFCYAGYLFVSALTLQKALHFSPRLSGDSFIALGIMFFVGSMISRSLVRKMSYFSSFALGSFITLVGFITTAVLIHHYNATITLVQLSFATGLVGLGNAFMLTSAYRIALSNVPLHQAGAASSALNTIQQSCFALGTAVAGACYSLFLNHGALNALGHAITVLSVILVLISLKVMHFKHHPQREAALEPGQ
ncbi:MFS transporter [Celerinatantimonas diazotrophica]|uniref:MFS transporter n=1 Tax=Celerinatantimonas diazotrophica TaxID=412034 RepID=A0A4R1K1Y6_9GAMM|nr:MFS transporter [Celerinatantimonas diazotrophica]TCK57683.1 MFS transporter [Celerinatantimonas diazotrophica]CAG9298255.1 Multidrug resistance protein Stp [Celerinatantimonas diazotrophica]